MSMMYGYLSSGLIASIWPPDWNRIGVFLAGGAIALYGCLVASNFRGMADAWSISYRAESRDIEKLKRSAHWESTSPFMMRLGSGLPVLLGLGIIGKSLFWHDFYSTPASIWIFSLVILFILLGFTGLGYTWIGYYRRRWKERSGR